MGVATLKRHGNGNGRYSNKQKHQHDWSLLAREYCGTWHIIDPNTPDLLTESQAVKSF